MSDVYEKEPFYVGETKRIELESLGTIRGICFGYPKGAKVVLYGNEIGFDETDYICMAMLYDFGPYFRPLMRGHSPGEIGMNMDGGPVGYFCCHSCPVGSTPPAQSHGSVLFNVTARPATEEELKNLPTSKNPQIRDMQKKLMAASNKAKELAQWMPLQWPIPGVPETETEEFNPIPDSEATRARKSKLRA